MLWLTGCSKIWRSVFLWWLSRCGDSGEDDNRAPFRLEPTRGRRGEAAAVSEAGHVLVIGVDGVRFDYLGPDATPAIWGLGQAGFLAPVPVDEATPTWSGPCWATIATGTGVAGHGITGNDLTGHRLAEHPDFVTRATRAGQAPRVSFVYLGAVDFAGHATGSGATYRAALLAADQRVGRLVAAVRSRPSGPEEDWTIVVVTDHGHLDEGGHGGREPEVATAWAAAAGPGIRPGGLPLITRQEEVAPLVLAAAGCPARRG